MLDRGDQVYGAILDGGIYEVYSHKGRGISTDIVTKKSTTTINMQGATQEEYKTGKFKFIENHIDEVNKFLGKIGCKERIDVKEYMSCVIHQLM